MVKIEQLKNGAKATVQRDGRTVPVFLHQLITRSELDSMQVLSGTVVYSIDELEILEKSAPAPAPAPRMSAKELAKAAKQQQTEE